MNRVANIVGLFAVVGAMANAAIVTLEDFSADPGGSVTDVDNILTVSYDGAGDFMEGSFALQPVSAPEEDGFSITLANFTGDYVTPGITQIAFDFFAVNIAPSYLFLNIVDGANVFSYQFTDLTGITGGFTTFTADLVYSSGWTGAGAGAFTTALGSVDSIEIFFGRNTAIAQDYRLDNLQTLDTVLGGGGGGGGGPSAVPEPNTLSFIAMIAAGGLAWRRRLMIRTAGNA